jgi:hypothetical protein
LQFLLNIKGPGIQIIKSPNTACTGEDHPALRTRPPAKCARIMMVGFTPPKRVFLHLSIFRIMSLIHARSPAGTLSPYGDLRQGASRTQTVGHDPIAFIFHPAFLIPLTIVLPNLPQTNTNMPTFRLVYRDRDLAIVYHLFHQLKRDTVKRSAHSPS